MSEKTLSQKMFIKEGMKVLIVNAPAGYPAKLGKLPKNATVVRESSAPADFVLVFVANRNELEKSTPRVKKLLSPNGMLWICYLKSTSKTKTDINRDTLHSAARGFGLEGVSLISIDDDWSAMRFKVV